MQRFFFEDLFLFLKVFPNSATHAYFFQFLFCEVFSSATTLLILFVLGLIVSLDYVDRSNSSSSSDFAPSSEICRLILGNFSNASSKLPGQLFSFAALSKLTELQFFSRSFLPVSENDGPNLATKAYDFGSSQFSKCFPSRTTLSVVLFTALSKCFHLKICLCWRFC